jgi:excinuclease ABC subunit A
MTAHPPAIEVVRARTHNLRGIDCRIPHRLVTVVTGLSGAGKSSLAFDTVYAEAQRRFVESMSTYARQFLEQMERPPIDAMHNILPAVALEARTSVKNARSTVGTLTEVHGVLRLIFTYLGEAGCPNGHPAVRRSTPAQAAEAAAGSGSRVTVLAPLERPRRLADAKLGELVRQGYFRRLEDGEIVRMTPSERWPVKLDPLLLVLGRYKTDDADAARRTAAIEEAYLLSGGKAQVFDGDSLDEDGSVTHFGRALTCEVCGASTAAPTPALFSFNSPLGACSECQGFGRVIGIDRGRVVPDPGKTLAERPIAPWNSPAYEKHYRKLFSACRSRGVPLDVPWKDLREADRQWIWSGRQGLTSIDRFFARLERKIYKVHVRVLLARYRAYDRCPACRGARLNPQALAVRWKGQTLPEITARSIEQLRDWLSAQRFRRAERREAGYLLEQLEERLETLHRVGLDYLTLDRQARTLDSGRLVALLRDLSRRGNTVLVVEHDRTLIRGADHVIDLGPRAGEHGGEVMAEGPLDEVLKNSGSLTARYLRDDTSPVERPSREALAERAAELAKAPRIVIRKASANNLRDVDVEFPRRALVAVTGVSGSGKSTLVENVLHGTYQRSRGTVDVEPGDCQALLGLDDLADVTLVDQRPLGRSSRSNPVTYVKAYDEIRKLFADTESARQRGIAAGHFSFNLDRGRCRECKGTGVLEVDMQFMAAVTVVCDVCQGRRFRPEILAIACRGRNIFETLELTVDGALEIFADRAPLCRRLEALTAVGLGYLRLGQPTSTLSGGEAQRLKLASFLDRPRSERRLFLFDEPTTGLHLADIDLLHSTFRRLIERGHGVVVVEHSTDLVARADWIVDLGPGGGIHGGELLYSGPLLEFLDGVDSPTAEELRGHLDWRRSGTSAAPAG